MVEITYQEKEEILFILSSVYYETKDINLQTRILSVIDNIKNKSDKVEIMECENI